MTRDPGDRSGKCREPGCKRIAAAQGMCRNHYTARRLSATSDGVMTGSAPKLSAEQVQQVKRWHAGFVTNIEIARRLGVHAHLIQKVLKGTYAPKRGVK